MLTTIDADAFAEIIDETVNRRLEAERRATAAQIAALRTELEQVKATAVPGPPGPAGERGEKGDKGDKGERGEHGDRGEHGAQGEKGEKGDAGAQGEEGAAGMPGRDGRDGMIGPTGEKGAAGERGEAGPAGARGERGETGPIGLGFGELVAELDHERGVVTLTAKRDELEQKIGELPWPTEHETWRSGKTYPQWASVTLGGQSWKARRATTGRPGHSEDWFLNVRQGLAGKNGKDGLDGQPGPEGRPGRDLTQMSLDGRQKWS